MKSLKRGFTLIELLVVIAIISILIAIGSTSYQRAVRLSRDSKRKTDLEQIRQALETYRSEIGTYPATKEELAPDYITSIPTDPTVNSYYYERPTTTTYILCSALEVTPTSVACSTKSCGSGVSCNYQTTNP